MRIAIAALAAASVLAWGTAVADLEPYTDYVPSKEVWNVAYVRVDPNRLDTYLEGLRQTWLGSCEIQKQLGVVSSCMVFVSETMSNRDFNVMLVTQAPSLAAGEPNEERYRKFMAEMRKKLAEDQERKLVEGYNELRTFFGEQNFRRLDFK